MKMKKILAFLFIYPTLFFTNAQNQISIPETPKKIEFANILVELNPEALKAVKTEVNNLLTPQNRFLDQKLERMQWYFPIIEKILEEEDIPEDMKYLAVMESSLLSEAISSSNAVGFWQFKEATAKEVGLKIDNNQDDRKNIHLSTKAAALYMKRNNLIFKNWISCLLAYNLGVQGASDKIPVDWSFASEIKFDENTHPYLIKALAHRIAYEHRLNRLKDSPRKFIEYPTKGKTLAEIAVELTTDITELKKYNQWLYSPNIQEDKLYNVLILSKNEDVEEINGKIQKRLDARKVEVDFPQLKRITMVSTSPDDPIFYEINGKKGILAQSGEEVAQLSSKAKIKIGKFLSYNNMTDRDLTKEGSIYYLQKKNKKAKVPFHTIRGEQTMWDISQMYGLSLKYLLKYNRMKNSQKLQSGSVIWLQKTRPKNQPIEVINESVEEKESLPVKENYTQKEEVSIETTPNAEKKYEEIEKPKDILNNEELTKAETKPVEVKEITKAKTKPDEVKPDGLKIDDDIFEPKNNTKLPTNTPPSKVEEIKNTPTKTISTKHMVKQGETLFSIAKKYGLTVNELRKMNVISPTESIKVNQLLTVGKSTIATKEEVLTKTQPEKKPIVNEPIGEEELVTVKPPFKETTAAAKFQMHTVAAGETLFSISKKYSITVGQIQKWNNLNNSSISLGQKLVVSSLISSSSTLPKPATETPSSAVTKYHTVAQGETLYSISRKYDANVGDIKKWNNMADNNIMVGSKIIIKK
jgi:membrane-bound lytic murein transglycosylase D